eukprot:m.331792 g.331792  ORF g.331792 m.331792 type:complete len:359 (-) comp16794_c0_seq1:160-1236(-)
MALSIRLAVLAALALTVSAQDTTTSSAAEGTTSVVQVISLLGGTTCEDIDFSGVASQVEGVFSAAPFDIPEGEIVSSETRCTDLSADELALQADNVQQSGSAVLLSVEVLFLGDVSESAGLFSMHTVTASIDILGGSGSGDSSLDLVFVFDDVDVAREGRTGEGSDQGYIPDSLDSCEQFRIDGSGSDGSGEARTDGSAEGRADEASSVSSKKGKKDGRHRRKKGKSDDDDGNAALRECLAEAKIVIGQQFGDVPIFGVNTDAGRDPGSKSGKGNKSGKGDKSGKEKKGKGAGLTGMVSAQSSSTVTVIALLAVGVAAVTVGAIIGNRQRKMKGYEQVIIAEEVVVEHDETTPFARFY